MANIKSKTIVFITLGLLFTGLAQAQESVNATGGDAAGSGGTVAYSVGQVVYTTHTGSLGSSAQGVQHAYEIFSFGINETALDISLTAFPNPTTDNLTLLISDFKNQKFSYQLFDIQGNRLGTGQIIAQQTIINMSHLPKATYFVDVFNPENNKVQSFKIIKN
ncbi:MAG: T9SS type A sorting domain-containing protein [Cryomorphaceae bacterium]|nr:T9SS type A sorting domain-containing protein [Cryomorphaceae bacterium]